MPIYVCDDLVTFVLFYHASQLRAATSVNTICQNPPKSPSWVGNRNICDRVVCDTLNAQYHINNINAHICVMIWSRSYYSITLLSSVQRPSTRFVKIPPKSPVLGR